MSYDRTASRDRRTIIVSNIILAFARQGVSIEAISLATATMIEQVRATCRRGISTGELLTMPPATSADRKSWMQTEIAKLREQVATLESLNKELRCEVHGKVDSNPYLGIANLTTSEAVLLNTLANAPRHVSKDRVYFALFGQRIERDQPQPKIVDVFVCKARKKLEKHGIEIGTVWGQGYALDADNKAKLRKLAGLPEVAAPALQPAAA